MTYLVTGRTTKSPFTFVGRQGVLQDAVFAQQGGPADLARVLPDGQGEPRWFVKDGAVQPVVERVGKFGVAAPVAIAT